MQKVVSPMVSDAKDWRGALAISGKKKAGKVITLVVMITACGSYPFNVSQALGQELPMKSPMTHEVLGIPISQIRRLRHRETGNLHEITQRASGQAWTRTRDGQTLDTGPLCGNQRDPFSEQSFL